MSLLSARTNEKEDMFTPIRAVSNTVSLHTHTDMYLCTHTQVKKAQPVWGLMQKCPNYYQLPYVNKPWHKGSDESATLNTLENLPKTSAMQTNRADRREGEIVGAAVMKRRQGGRDRTEEEEWVKTRDIYIWMEREEDLFVGILFFEVLIWVLQSGHCLHLDRPHLIISLLLSTSLKKTRLR